MLRFELQSRGLARFLPSEWNLIWPVHRRSVHWGPSGGSIAERAVDLRQFRAALATNYFVHMTGGLDHDLAYVSRHR